MKLKPMFAIFESQSGKNKIYKVRYDKPEKKMIFSNGEIWYGVEPGDGVLFTSKKAALKELK